jgi:hypothetical protein
MEEVKKTEKKKFPTSIIVIIIIVLIFAGGVFYATNLVKNRIANTFPGVSVDSKNSTYKTKVGNVDTVVSEKEVAWPSDIPQDVPKFQGGKIKAVSHEKTSNIWVIAVSDTTQLEFNNYKTYLQNANWKAEDQTDALVNISTMIKGENKITVIFDSSSKGILITLSPIK